MTYTSNRKKAQASTRLGLQEARAASEHWGRRLSVSPTAKNEFGMNIDPLVSGMRFCSPPSGERQLAADLSNVAKLNFFYPNLV